MPTIYCSTKLTSLIGPQNLVVDVQQNESGRLNAWNAQMFFIQSRKCILVANKATLYSFVRLNVLKKDFKDLTSFFIDSLTTQLEADGLHKEFEFNDWLDRNNRVDFCRTDNDKRVIGSINDLIYQLKVAISYNVGGLVYPTDTSAGSYVNRLIMNYNNLDTSIVRLRKAKNNI